MDNELHTTLATWANFYLITGSAAAALTGLQFVVQTLIASAPNRTASTVDPESTIAAFGTPTVVHFSLALLLSALLCAPWTGYEVFRATLGVLGVGALVYAAVVLRRTLRQQNYKPVMEDWVWHIMLPAVAYAAVLVTAVLLGRGAEGPLFIVAGATLLLLCVGIHNAWDTVAYLSARVMRRSDSEGQPAPARRPEPKVHGKRRR